MSAKTEEDPAKRAAKRSRVLMTAVLFTPDGALKVRVRDISSTGAYVHADIRMLSECDAIFKKGSLFVAARVAWSRDRDAGISFYRELDANEMTQLFHPLLVAC